MTSVASPAAIVALVYAAGTDPAPVLRAMAAALDEKGLKCAGFIQRDTVRPERSRCDMVLEDIRTGIVVPISEDRGSGARGCRLDESELTRAMMRCAEALDYGPDVLFINKFGKTESEGRGFRPLIADALERDVPVVIAVPWTNIDNWRRFAGDFCIEVHIEAELTQLVSLVGMFSATGPSSVARDETDSDGLDRAPGRTDGHDEYSEETDSLSLPDVGSKTF